MTCNHASKDQRIMLLDIGNTNLKWAWLEEGAPGHVTSVSHKERSIEQLADMEWANIRTPAQTYISNVADPAMEPRLTEWMSGHWGHAPRFIRSAAHACGVTNSYRDAGRLGVDRWLTMIALYARYSGPVCVVDCGTAVTIDVLGLDGQHLGGLILPGFGLMQHALLQHTAIPFKGEVELDGMLATDTESAIAAGGVSAVAALVERIQQDQEARLEKPLALVLTGSDAERLAQALTSASSIETGLVMQGLVVLINSESG
jgi:type III pantothenate kinase